MDGEQGEEEDLQLLRLVWAQQAKYPPWPAGKKIHFPESNYYNGTHFAVISVCPTDAKSCLEDRRGVGKWRVLKKNGKGISYLKISLINLGLTFYFREGRKGLDSRELSWVGQLQGMAPLYQAATLQEGGREERPKEGVHRTQERIEGAAPRGNSAGEQVYERSR